MASLLQRMLVPSLPAAGGGGSILPVITNGQVTSYTVEASGQYYINTPNLAVLGGGGQGATGTITLNASGGIASVTPVNLGSGFVSVPQAFITPVLSLADHQVFQAQTSGILTAVVHSCTFCNYDPSGAVHPIWVQLMNQAQTEMAQIGAGTPVVFGTTLTSRDFTLNMEPGDYLLMATDYPGCVSCTINYVNKS